MFQKSAKPVAKTLSSSSHKKRVREADAAMTPTPFSTSSSLVHLCRMVITTNLERYPPEAFGVCDGDEWETLVRLRHARTQPKRRWRSSGNHSSCAPGSLSSTSNHSTASSVENGGIDGTGRMVPAIADKIMIAIEICNPHLSDCETTDYLVWKDCVEYKFRRGTCSSRSGAALLMTRPTALLLPWPILIQNLQRYASRLVPLSSSTQSSCEDISEAIEALRTTPMNVTLLKDSGVGKIVKKAIKRVDVEHKEQLEGLLAIWMVMAQEDGVVSGDATMVKATSTKHDDASSKTTRTDLKLAATCQSWRHLFRVLWNRNEEIRTQQGKRMREIRNNVSGLL